MKCAYCGKHNKDGAITCKRCGMALPLTPPPVRNDGGDDDLGSVDIGSGGPSGNKSSGKRTLVAVCAALLAILLCALIIALAGRGGNYISPVSGAYNVTDGTAVFRKGAPVLPELKIADAKTDMSGGKVAVLAENGELYCLPERDTPVARNVASFTLSRNGKYLIYKDVNGLLWSHACAKKDGAPVCICNSVVKDGYAVSPDGKSVAYCVEGDPVMHLFSSGKYKELGEGFEPVSVSNGAKHVYAYSAKDNALCYINRRGKSVILRSGLRGGVCLNSTHEEAVFTCGFGGNADSDRAVTLISVNGAEPKEIADSVSGLAPVIPVGAVCMSGSGAQGAVTYPVKSFNNAYFAGGKLVKYSFRDGTVTIDGAGDCGSAVANKAFDHVYYLNGARLMSLSTKGKTISTETLAENCAGFRISGSGSVQWYLTGEGDLMYRKGSAEKLIAKDVTDLVVTPSGKEALFISGGRLCSNTGGNPKRSFVYEGTASALAADASGLYCRTDAGWMKLDGGGKKLDLTAE